MSDVPLHDPLKVQRDEVLRKIGRNVVLFQHVEMTLKALLTVSTTAGSTHEEVERHRERRQNTVGKKTLGNLVGQFVDKILIAPEPSETITRSEETSAGSSFACRFNIDGDGYYEHKTARMAALVDERNQLIHHALTTFDLQSTAGLTSFDQHLELQAGRIRAEASDLEVAMSSLVEGRKQLVEYFASGEGAKAMELAWLQGSQIVQLLRDIAQEVARADGWSLLQLAGWHLHERAPEEASSYTMRYGHKSLKALLMASELFDLRDEPTEKGGVRVLYRLRRCATVA